MVRYRSSRSTSHTTVPFADALLQGLAPDGGLFLPQAVPPLPSDWQQSSSLAELAATVLPPWLGDTFSADAIAAIAEDALNFSIPLHTLAPDVHILELFHGPTLSFKDVGARMMARMMAHILAERGGERIILVATSGDTGSAVADAFAGLPPLRVVLLYPTGKVSTLQERQLIVARPGVQALAVRGDFDACQQLVKAAFQHPAFEALPLSSANSINVGRLLPQMLYYLWAVLQYVQRQPTAQDVHIAVPSGNLGNACAALLAAQAGMPLRRLLIAHNANRFFSEYLQGTRAAFDYLPTVPTLANAMDVGAPSNFERLHHLFGREHLQQHAWACSVDDASSLHTMRDVYTQHGYSLCPHSAIGVAAWQRYQASQANYGDGEACISLATAHPAKFPEALQQASVPVVHADGLESLRDSPSAVQTIPADIEALHAAIVQG